MSYKSLLLLFILGGFSALLYSPSTAQGPETCPALVDDALNRLETSCDDTDRNFACYGNNNVQARFMQEVEPEFFTMPGDRAALDELENIAAQPLNLDANTWGIALMKAQANLPGTLPGQAVVFLLLGDTYVENDVSNETARTGEAVVSTRAAFEVVLRVDPNPTAEAVVTLPVGTELTADATATSNGWVRVTTSDEQFGWLPPGAITDTDAVASLPEVDTAQPQSPMQSFYFSTGIGNSSCEETPDTLIVQGPEQLTVDIRANGADISIGSTIALLTYEMMDPPQMELIVLEDEATITCPDGRTITILEGFSTRGTLSDLQDLGIVEAIQNRVVPICDWTEPEEVSPERLLQIAGPAYNISDGILNYELDLPENVVLVPPLPTNTPTPLPPPAIVVPVQPSATPTPVPFVPTDTPTPVPPPPDDDDDDDDDDGGDDTVVVQGVDLSPSGLANVEFPEGSSGEFKAFVTNVGTETANTGVIFVDINSLPDAIGFSGVNTEETDGNYDPELNEWTVGPLDPGDTAVLTIVLSFGTGSAGNYNVPVSLISSDPADMNAANDSGSGGITVLPAPEADLAVNIEAVPLDPIEGDTVQFTLNVTNNGPSAATDVVVGDDIHDFPAVFVPPTALIAPPQGNYDYPTGTWNVGDIPAGTTVSYVFDIQTDPGSAGLTADVTNNIRFSTSVDNNAANDSEIISITPQ